MTAELKGGGGTMNGYTGHRPMVAHNMVTTQFELDGFRVVRTMGVVRGIIVRPDQCSALSGRACKPSLAAISRC